ncbi:hypothetical protein [Pseudomonas beijingensis]|uniref:hypothetical protein n=1 Tax=Pseudomonas beijingensis TaxID=2954101 RepID=UPI002735360D|nr:hypothetical protein [Pseudomonas sp. FP2262]WLH43958.1 hypothetical protein PSH83_16340 [Pseudomonas sp. FP2262]
MLSFSAGLFFFVFLDFVMAVQVVITMHAQLRVTPGVTLALRAFSGAVAAFWWGFFGGLDVKGLMAEVDVPPVAFDFDGERVVFSFLGEVFDFLRKPG